MSPASMVVLALLLTGCVQIEDRRAKTPDTALAVRADSSRPAISDKSLRPPPQGDDFSTPVRGRPDMVVAALAGDTASTPLVVDSNPASRAVPGDLAMLKGELAMPVSGVAPASLHDTYDELRGGTRPHDALDILAPRGTAVLSASSGRVLKLFDSKAGGLMVYAADSAGRFILMYGHLDGYAPGLAEGQRLARGQQIGFVGTTGNAPANIPHLHFAIARSFDLTQWWKGAPVNPFPLLTAAR